MLFGSRSKPRTFDPRGIFRTEPGNTVIFIFTALTHFLEGLVAYDSVSDAGAVRAPFLTRTASFNK
jgi:hypothetical protein